MVICLRRGSFTAETDGIMSRKLKLASAIAVAVTMVFTISGAAASGAFAQEQGVQIRQETVVTPPEAGAAGIRFVSQEVVQPLPTESAVEDSSDIPSDADSLEELVAAMPSPGDMSKDMACLAGAIYFEARGEPLIGQLAVGNVIVNRAESGRFPASYCGVVYQPSQFSFIRGGRMPSINKTSSAWREAAAIARIAHEGLWESPAEDALFFHASYVKPGWNLKRVARVSRHVFYR